LINLSIKLKLKLLDQALIHYPRKIYATKMLQVGD